MNNKPFGNIDFSELILADNDEANNVFTRNKQIQDTQQLAYNMASKTENGYMAAPNTVNTQEQTDFGGNIVPTFDLHALNKGFEEAKFSPTRTPIYTAESNNTGGPIFEAGINSAVPVANLSAAMSMPVQTNMMLPERNFHGHMADNQVVNSGRNSINPYADFLASTQQVNTASSNNMMETNMQGPITRASNYVQEVHPHHQAVQIPNLPRFMPNAFPMISSSMNRSSAKKKGLKATAYDIMIDFVASVPMFTHMQKVYIYNGECGCYEYKTQYEVEQMIMDRYRAIIREHGSGTLIEKVYKLLLKEPQIVRNETPLSDPTKISFKNCTVDLQSQTINYHSPSNVVTHALTCDLARFNHQSEECPTFDKFLHDISGGDILLENCMWEIVGYCLTQDTKAKKFFVFQGVPDSGKSLFCDLLMDFFPEGKVSALNVHSLKEQFAMGNLESMALCVSPDLPASAMDAKSASSIKQLTGNDKVSAAVKYKSNAQFRFEGKLILATNYPLLTAEPDDAFMQRAVVVPFMYAIPKEEQDRTLLDRLKAEKPAIASKALDAYFRLRNNHYKFSGNYVINSSLLYPEDLLGNPEITPLVYNYLMNCFERDPEGLVAIEAAYEVFSQEISSQFTEKMFSSVFQRLAEDIYGANRIRSYHGGKYKHARSSIEGIRFKQRFYQSI